MSNAQAIKVFLEQPKHDDISHLAITPLGLKVLADIRRFLYFPHVVQEIVSAEKTPTLSIVLPIYEDLIVMLKNLRTELPEIAHAISASITKLEEYLVIARRTKVYALAIGMSIDVLSNDL
jgi:hypothetical protein